MKSTYKITALCALALAVSLGVTASVHAEETSVGVEVEAQLPAGSPIPVRGDIKSQIQIRKKETKPTLGERVEAKKELRAEIKDVRTDARMQIKTLRASTTDMFKRAKDMRQDIKKKMEIRQFEMRKNALVRELTHALSNLANIITRIESRITKAESAGRDMTEPRTLLVTAREKVEKAKIEVAAFQTLTTPPISTTATASTTVEVDLVKPRQLGDAAIKSVKDARGALQKVVVSIAQHMGLKTGQNASTTVDASINVTN